MTFRYLSSDLVRSSVESGWVGCSTYEGLVAAAFCCVEANKYPSNECFSPLLIQSHSQLAETAGMPLAVANFSFSLFGVMELQRSTDEVFFRNSSYEPPFFC